MASRGTRPRRMLLSTITTQRGNRQDIGTGPGSDTSSEDIIFPSGHCAGHDPIRAMADSPLKYADAADSPGSPAGPGSPPQIGPVPAPPRAPPPGSQNADGTRPKGTEGNRP